MNIIFQMFAHFDAKHSKTLASGPNMIKIRPKSVLERPEMLIYTLLGQQLPWLDEKQENGGLKSIASFIPTAPFNFFNHKILKLG